MRDINRITPEIQRKRDEVRELEFRTRQILGANMRKYRKRHQLTQADLADLIGRTRVSVMNIESGVQEISMPVFLKVCQILKATPNDLLLMEKKCSSAKRATCMSSSGNSTS